MRTRRSLTKKRKGILASVRVVLGGDWAKHAYLDTFSFQAPEFYKKQGYQCLRGVEGFSAGISTLFYDEGVGIVNWCLVMKEIATVMWSRFLVNSV
jgi:hypothetical protein